MLSEIIPLAPLHYTTILHYLVLLLALTILVVGGSGDVSNLFLFALMLLAAITGVSLYINFFPRIPDFFVFLGRTMLVAIPAVIAGTAPDNTAQGLGILTTIIAMPLLAIAFLDPFMPGFLTDPRIPW